MKKGFVQAIVGGVVMTVIMLIIVFAVLQPVTNQLIAPVNATTTAQNLTGYTVANTVAQQLPTFNILIGLAVVASLVLLGIGLMRQ